MSQELACLDGLVGLASETLIPVTDEGLVRGDGVFEVVRVYHGAPFALEAHLDRIERSATNLRLALSSTREELRAQAANLLEARGGGDFDGCLRIMLTRGGRTILITEPLPPSPEQARLAFVEFAPSRLLDGVKSLSYAANMLASRIARERGFDEALLVTPHGRVLEAPTSTIFWTAPDGRLLTPPLDDHILASITRRYVVELTGAEECACEKEEILRAGEAFLASTTREVQPVAQIEDVAFRAPGERTVAARDALRTRIQEELAAGS